MLMTIRSNLSLKRDGAKARSSLASRYVSGLAMKCISTILFLISLTIPNGVLAEYTRYGSGMNSCGSWVEARRKQDFYTEGQWVRGYLTAYGYYGSYDLKEVDSGAVSTFMDNSTLSDSFTRHLRPSGV